jgi:hypothetical protein
MSKITKKECKKVTLQRLENIRKLSINATEKIETGHIKEVNEILLPDMLSDVKSAINWLKDVRR